MQKQGPYKKAFYFQSIVEVFYLGGILDEKTGRGFCYKVVSAKVIEKLQNKKTQSLRKGFAGSWEADLSASVAGSIFFNFL